MHRCMKKHPRLETGFESDSAGSSDSSGNGNVEPCQKHDGTCGGVKRRLEEIRSNLKEYKCPICERDFSGVGTLKIHLAEIHPDYPAEQCKHCFPGRKVLNLEKPPMDNTRDLADIQTILSMTTNRNFMHHLSKNHISYHDQQDTIQEEEAQDIFAVEFRKMKLRGEFPCRLCTSVFPNLRALKGHNRTHLNGNCNGTYYCNMCPYSSRDRTAIVRHMRTHNGDRPFKCSLCKFAFTTKANCERHLRNKHNKNTKDEVRSSIVYHLLEDGVDCDRISKFAGDDVNKMNSSSNSNTDDSDTMSSTLLSSQPLENNDPRPCCIDQKNVSQNSLIFRSNITETSTPKKRAIYTEAMDVSGDDITQDDKPIDLSKKTEEHIDKSVPSEQESPEDLSSKAPATTEELLRNGPYENFYNHLAMLQSFPHWPYPFLPQLLFAHLFHPKIPLPNPLKQESSPSQVNNGVLTTSSGQHTHQPSPAASSPESLVQVIKNGVIMPKQKQLRYRTERPFECEYCLARFTLRSNMERHVKQQHPLYWSQRQANLNARRKVMPVEKNVDDSTKDAVPDQMKYAILNQHLMASKANKTASKESSVVGECAREIGEGDGDLTKGNLKENRPAKGEESQDLVPVSRLLDNASHQAFKEYFKNESEGCDLIIDEDEDDLLASDDVEIGENNRSENQNGPTPRSADSSASSCISCPYCKQRFPWSSSLEC